MAPASKASSACWSYEVMNTTWQRPATRRATSMPAQQRHVDVEKRQVRRMRLDGVERGHAVVGPRDDAQLRPQRVQQVGQLVGEQRFVLRQDRGRRGPVRHASSWGTLSADAGHSHHTAGRAAAP